MAKRKKKKLEAIDLMGPTDEQQEHFSYERATLAYRRVPVIVTLASKGTLTQRQFDALSRYRDIGLKCEQSSIMDSCQRLLHIAGGGKDGMSPATLRAYQELGWLEQELGQLVDIARAICIDDVSLSQWAMNKAGSVMREREGVGRKIIRWFEPRAKALKDATMEIRMAGERLAAAIDA